MTSQFGQKLSTKMKIQKSNWKLFWLFTQTFGNVLTFKQGLFQRVVDLTDPGTVNLYY